MAQRSTFFSLPAELRNQIYEYLVPDCAEVFVSRVCAVQPPVISQVCHQIRAEFSSYLPRRLANTHTLTFKAINCDFRHVIKTFVNLTEGELDNLECLKLGLSFNEDGVLDCPSFVDLVDALFSSEWIWLEPGGVRGRGYRWQAVTEVVKERRKNIRHELVVDVEHKEIHCPCGLLARAKLHFPRVQVGKTALDKALNPKEMLKNEMESALRLSHDRWVIKKVEEKAAEKKRVREAVGELEVLMKKLKIG